MIVILAGKALVPALVGVAVTGGLVVSMVSLSMVSLSMSHRHPAQSRRSGCAWGNGTGLGDDDTLKAKLALRG